VCSGGHCGTPVDAGSCSLDPGGTPCSQCIVNNCCSETETCLCVSYTCPDPECGVAMGCFQDCIVGGSPPATCRNSCCSTGTCDAWTNCVTAHCGGACY
jgi:hypothetical protein